MSGPNTRKFRESLSPFTKKSTSKAAVIFLVDIAIYVSALIGVIFFNSVFLKFICGFVVGLKMASLFVIAHDSAHDSFFNNSLLNKIVGRLAFLPSYHNYSLWLIVHNRQHHQSTNMKLINSWSPLSVEDFNKLSVFGKTLERLYRCPFGISFNYLIERWWKNKFYPFKRVVGKHGAKYWLDFILVFSYMSAQIGVFVYLGMSTLNNSVLEMLIFGYFLPLIVFSFMVGASVYQQHTHETVPWFENETERKKYGYVEDVTLHIQYPHWYNVLSHNVMEHTAHHVDPRIPSYNLEKAQSELIRLYGNQLIVLPFSLSRFLQTMKKCKLYDYHNHCWTNFNGEATSPVLIESEIDMYLQAA